MDQENNSIPPSSQPAPQQGGQGDDSLYAQITAEDVIQPVAPKKKRPALFVQLLVYFMKATFYLDSVKRTYEPTFVILRNIWAGFMSLIYVGGLLTLVFALYSMMQLPLYVADQLRERGLKFEDKDVKLSDLSMTRLEVGNLRDSKGKYEIDSLIINSTFADFLQKRIRSVTLNGVKIYVESEKNKSIFEEIPEILHELQNPTRGNLGLAIDAVTINDATLVFQDGETQLPISFTMVGVYNQKTDIIITLGIDQPNISASGTLTIGGSSVNPEWTLEILKGVVTLPKRSQENLKGRVKLKIKQNRIEDVDFDLKLAFGTLEKTLEGFLHRVSDEGMNASIVWNETNLTEPDLSSQVRFNFEELILGKDKVISHRPVQVYIQSLVTSLMKLKDLNTMLEGELECRNWTECEMSLTNPATVTVQESGFSYGGKNIRGTTENAFVLQPSDSTLFLSLYDPYLKLNWKMEDVSFSGFIETEEDPVVVHADHLNAVGSFSDAQHIVSKLAVQTSGMDYKTNKLKLSDVAMSISDVIDPKREVRFSGKNIQTSLIPLLTMPFDLDLVMVGSQLKMRIHPLDTPIVATLEGHLLPFQSMFSGKISIPAFNVQDVHIPLNDISPILTSNIQKLTGQVAVGGSLVWKGQNTITGPLQIAAKGMSFSWAGSSVKNLSTVITLDSILPFATASNQHMFVESIESVVPFMSTEVLFQIESQALRLIGLNTYLGNVEFSLSPSIIPLKNPSMLMFMKNINPINLSSLREYANTPQIASIQGTASASIPVEIQGRNVNIPNVTLKIDNATLKREGDAWSSVFGADTDYIIRSGQLLLSKDRTMQVSLDGRLFPSRQKKSVELSGVKTPSVLFTRGVKKDPPKVILDALKPFFGELK